MTVVKQHKLGELISLKITRPTTEPVELSSGAIDIISDLMPNIFRHEYKVFT